jgi:hypothetical protein
MLLIDGDHLFVYRIGFAVERDPNGMNAAKYNIRCALDQMINATLDFTHKIFITGKDNFRDKVATLLPYKGNRIGARKPKYYRQIREHLVEEYDAIIVDGIEADDAMGIEQMKSYHESTFEGDTAYCDSTIVACDKDMDMIPGKHYNPIKKKEYWISEIEGMRNFYTQCLTGDSTDNIPGLKGIGPITAKKMLKNCETAEEMEQKVRDAYFDQCRIIRCNVPEGHYYFFKLALKGIDKRYDTRNECFNAFNEIKQLLWIRRE